MATRDAKIKSPSPLVTSITILVGILCLPQTGSSSGCYAGGLFGTIARVALGALPSLFLHVSQTLAYGAFAHHHLPEAVFRIAGLAGTLVKALATIA